MAWSVPASWAVAEVVVASKMNAQIRDNLNYLKGTSAPVTIDNDLTAVLAVGGTLTAQGTNNGSFARLRLLTKRTAGTVVDWRLLANGLSDAGELVFYDATAGAERLRIDNAGNVGVGTSAPQGKLHVGNASGQGGFLQYGYSGLGAIATTILPAGSVIAGMTVSYVTTSSGGGANASQTTLTTSGGNVQLFNAGGTEIFQLNYVAGGSVTLTRSAGTRTYSGTILIGYY